MPMTQKLILIRHGETLWNREGRCQGFSDIALNDAGEEQARALARALRDSPLAAVYASDLVRARKTAEIIAAPHRLPVAVDPRLRELNQGDMEGKSLTSLLTDFPDQLALWMRTPADVTMPHGESMRSLAQRVHAALDNIASLHPEHTVAIVSHNLALRTIICRAINLDLNHFRRFRLDNASISIIVSSAHGPVLESLNDVHHLK
jgi:phosphoserine phosphatase